MKNRLLKQISRANFHFFARKGDIKILVVEGKVEDTRSIGTSTMRWTGWQKEMTRHLLLHMAMQKA